MRQSLAQLLRKSVDDHNINARPALKWRLHLTFQFRRKYIQDGFSMDVRANQFFIPIPQEDLKPLAKMINDGVTSTSNSSWLQDLDMTLVPRVFELGKLHAVVKIKKYQSTGKLKHHIANTTSGAPMDSWSMQVPSVNDCYHVPWRIPLKAADDKTADDKIEFVLLNDLMAQTTFFAYIVGLGGVIGLYISGVLVVGQFVSLYFSQISHRSVIFPCVHPYPARVLSYLRLQRSYPWSFIFLVCGVSQDYLRRSPASDNAEQPALHHTRVSRARDSCG